MSDVSQFGCVSCLFIVATVIAISVPALHWLAIPYGLLAVCFSANFIIELKRSESA